MKHWFLALLGEVREEFVKVYTAAGQEMSKVVTVKMTRRAVAWWLGSCAVGGFILGGLLVWKLL